MSSRLVVRKTRKFGVVCFETEENGAGKPVSKRFKVDSDCNNMDIEHRRSDDMPANLLTKPLTSNSDSSILGKVTIKKKEVDQISSKLENIQLSPSTSTTKITTTSKYLSDQLVAATNGIQDIDLSSQIVKDILEPHLEKCRQSRVIALKQQEIDNNGLLLQDVINKLGNLSQEEIVNFDTNLYKIRESFTQLLFSSENDESTCEGEDDTIIEDNTSKFPKLSEIHHLISNDKGKKKQRDEKYRLLSPLLNDSYHRRKFQQQYEELVMNIILPNAYNSLPLSSQLQCQCQNHDKADAEAEAEMYYQAFPCIRLVRPGEFSIGIHADCNYGFQYGNINYYLPLTKINGSNSLAIESIPLKEDWHFLNINYGNIQRFHGSVCSHFTVENTSPITRVSFDFRVIPSSLYTKHPNDRYSFEPGYYVKAKWCPSSGSKSGYWKRVDPLPENGPDWRSGFPFVK
jgi:hypothetical protein